MDPQQELFSKLKIEIERKGYDVYDGFLPPENTPYPFIYLGDSRQVDDTNKTAVFGNVFQTIHFWSNTPRNRGTLSTMMLDVKMVCRKLKKTKNFSWIVRNIDQTILPDKTTKTPLLHGVLEVEFKFS